VSLPILYLGDTSLQTAAAYLAGLIHARGWLFDYVPSDCSATSDLLDSPRSLYILSDYPQARFEPELQQRMLEYVRRGAGLVMIGGWESYHGMGGDWDTSPVAEALPVQISSQDDRVHFDQPALLRCCDQHPILVGLPWQTRPPGIGGLNRFQPRLDATVLLEAQHFSVRAGSEGFLFEPSGRDTVLAVGQYGQGRTAALATDVAPHWVGGLVDWGTSRVAARAPGAEAIEVGDSYARFFQQLLAWAGRLDTL
jgi:uncharacterized membrane protein